MTRLSIRVNGNLVRQGLENLAAEIPQIGRRRLRTVMDRIQRWMQTYPAPLPNQKYQRTFKLRDGWKIEEIPNGYAIENRASRRGREYPGYVVGDAYGTGQAWMHAGRWEKFRDVVEAQLLALPEEIEQEIQMVARREGL